MHALCAVLTAPEHDLEHALTYGHAALSRHIDSPEHPPRQDVCWCVQHAQSMWVYERRDAVLAAHPELTYDAVRAAHARRPPHERTRRQWLADLEVHHAVTDDLFARVPLLPPTCETGAAIPWNEPPGDDDTDPRWHGCGGTGSSWTRRPERRLGDWFERGGRFRGAVQGGVHHAAGLGPTPPGDAEDALLTQVMLALATGAPLPPVVDARTVSTRPHLAEDSAPLWLLAPALRTGVIEVPSHGTTAAWNAEVDTVILPTGDVVSRTVPLAGAAHRRVRGAAWVTELAAALDRCDPRATVTLYDVHH